MKKTIYIDYGHTLSGGDTGAEGCGYLEQNLTREIGSMVKCILDAHGALTVVVSPNYCISLSSSLEERVRHITDTDGLFISFHFNASNGAGHGTEVWTYNSNTFIEAQRVLDGLVNLGFSNRGIKDGSKLYVVRRSLCRAMLIETCFIDNKSDMDLFKSKKQEIANVIASAILGQSITDTKQGWNQNSTGWWYCTDTNNGYYYKTEWKRIDGEWYYFDDNGYAEESKWERCGLQDWCYLDSNCKMVKSCWKWIDGECYCFDKNGNMYSNCITPDGYKVDETGAWVQ